MFELNLQYFAHKKGVGSTKNGRDSESKRLGAKRADGQFVKAGNILYRHRLPMQTMYHLRRVRHCCRDGSWFHAVCIKYYLP